ncbi:MAG: AAA family ATPase, partial [Hydrogenophaga sp.]
PYLQALPEPLEACHETHISWVLLAGPFAYKIKKPVKLPFMDFSTLALRRAACEAEIRVNRRFERADDPVRLYLEVLPITGTADDPAWGGAAEHAFEFAVHMHRFDEAGRLDHLCQRGALTAEHLQALARRLAAFQASAAVATEPSPWGKPQAVLQWARDNLESLRLAPAQAASPAAVQTLTEWTESSFQALEFLLNRRRLEGRVREGHGDLHLANLVLIDDSVLPFDAIEFNDSLRWIDVASDLAFAWMDLQHQDRIGLASVLLSEWLDASGDVRAPQVLPFFAVYRALVRAKVAAIRLGQVDAASAEADTARAACSAYLALAQRMAHPPAPALVITHGLSGSGKTWASTRWLAGWSDGPAIRLRSDVERKRLHGLSALQTSGSNLQGGLYTPQAHGDTYASLLARARTLLAEGWTVLVDAAFLRQHERQAFAELAHAKGCPFHILACEAPVEVLRERITARQAGGRDASEATLDVLEQQLGWLEPLTADERGRCLP